MKKRDVTTKGVGTGFFFEVEAGDGFDIEAIESFEPTFTPGDVEPGLSPVLASFGPATAKAEAVDLLTLAREGKKTYTLEILEGSEVISTRARRFIVNGKDLFLDNALLNGLYSTEKDLLSAYEKFTGLDLTEASRKTAKNKIDAHLALLKGSQDTVNWQKGLRISKSPVRYLNARVANIR
jgi:hypothetical protein